MNSIATAIVEAVRFQKDSANDPHYRSLIESLLDQLLKKILSEVETHQELKNFISSLESDPDNINAQKLLSDLISSQQKNISTSSLNLAKYLYNHILGLKSEMSWGEGSDSDELSIPTAEEDSETGKFIKAPPAQPEDIPASDIGEFQSLLDKTFGGSEPSNAEDFPVAEATPPTKSWREILQEEIEQLQVGQIAFNPPAIMKVGKPDRVEVRITRERNSDFVSTMKGRGHPQIEEIQVYEFMRVDLSGDDFTILSLNELDQLVTSSGFTEWAWTVTPNKRGQKVLHLHVSLKIKLPDSEKAKDHPVIDKEIDVKVNPAYSGKRFVKENWKWLITALVIPLLGVIWKALS
jgi:hypothetical protein